jgi:hypothetical protein
MIVTLKTILEAILRMHFERLWPFFLKRLHQCFWIILMTARYALDAPRVSRFLAPNCGLSDRDAKASRKLGLAHAGPFTDRANRQLRLTTTTSAPPSRDHADSHRPAQGLQDSRSAGLSFLVLVVKAISCAHRLRHVSSHAK